ncbi:ABC transporter ATP-binding protein [Chloroflexota bacterium]
MSIPAERNGGQPGTGEPIVRLEKVSKSYRMGAVEVKALSDVSLEVMAGEFVVFLGPSGSGKTTLLNLVGGLDSPSSGQVIVNGINITHMKANQLTGFRRTQIGFIFQFFNLIPTLTAKENVELASELVAHRMSSEALLREVGLGDRMNHFPGELSGGENQRVAIARALATDSPLLVCDEPTGSLDFETGKRIFKLLMTLNDQKRKTIIVVTHNAPVGDIAHRVIRMRDGKITDIVQNTYPLDPEELKW